MVFVSPCAGKLSQYPNSGLYLLDLETNAIALLFPNPAGDFEPAWSPDGTKIAFTSLRSGSMQIYVYKQSDASLTQLTLPGNNTQSRYPAWSPDGAKIAYTVRRLGLLQIWIMDADGSHPEQLTRPGGSSSDYLPTWSKDGQYLLFSETNAELTAPASLMQFVFGDEKARILPVQRPVVDVDFSPDGQWIAYETSDAKNQDIFIYRLFSGVAPQQLTVTGSSYFDPAWRPRK
jgi:Tol biopolymer transport system component